MQRSKLKQQALDYYRHSPVSCWILGTTTGFLVAAILAIDLLVPFLSFLTIPLLVVPVVFCATIQHVMLKTDAQITMTSSFRTFALYFKRDFFGTFSVIFNFVKSLLLFLIVETVVSSVASFLIYMFNPQFESSVNSLYQLLYSYEFTYEDIVNQLNANNYLLLQYIVISFVPACGIALIFFIYNLSRYSMMIYYKMQLKRTDSRFAKLVYQFSLRGRRMEMARNYLSLQWPLYVLVGLGFAGGAVFGYFFYHDLMKILPFALVGSAVLAAFFLPFYFSNQQAFYDMYASLYNQVTKSVTTSIIGNLQSDIELSKQEKERLEETLSDMDGPLNDEHEGEDNKKDPGGS